MTRIQHLPSVLILSSLLALLRCIDPTYSAGAQMSFKFSLSILPSSNTHLVPITRSHYFFHFSTIMRPSLTGHHFRPPSSTVFVNGDLAFFHSSWNFVSISGLSMARNVPRNSTSWARVGLASSLIRTPSSIEAMSQWALRWSHPGITPATGLVIDRSISINCESKLRF